MQAVQTNENSHLSACIQEHNSSLSNVSHLQNEIEKDELCDSSMKYLENDHNQGDILKNCNSIGKKQNVSNMCQQWCVFVKSEILRLLHNKKGGNWSVTQKDLEVVKSYGPHIWHVVLDLDCIPLEACK